MKLQGSIDVEALSTALLVFEIGSFRAAAARLRVAPSVVSRRVRRLEDQLGVSLFHRQPHGVSLTFSGQSFLTSSKSLLVEFEQLVQSAGRTGTAMEGALRIGISGSAAGGSIRHLLELFLRAHPLVAFDLVEGSVRQHLAALRALRLDAAVLY